ncbi:hypothetical protein UlMin_034306 [Ulmus minor]
MSPPVSGQSPDISSDFTDEEIFNCLGKLMSGSPLPSNVISDVNPYQHKPSNLPEGIWFFLNTKANKETNDGYWRTNGEACRVFSHFSITGWRSTLVFYEGKAPHWHQTDWVMKEYWITKKELPEDGNEKAPSLLCRVFFRGVSQAEMSSQLTHSAVGNSENYTGQGSTSRPQISEDYGAGPAVRERLPENLLGMPEVDYVSAGDFLELRDLDIPASPSSSSDSSCVTMSSDDCFDALELLQDLEPEARHDHGRNDTDCKLRIFASSKPSEMIMHPASTETLDKLPTGKMPSNNNAKSGSAYCIKTSEKKVSKNTSRNQNPNFRDEEGTSAMPVENKKKGAPERMKKLKKKYLCFMPF